MSRTMSPRMEHLTIPPRHRFHARQSSTGASSPLRLPSLPRFHPANFVSPNSTTSSLGTTPATGPNSPSANTHSATHPIPGPMPAPLSPRTAHQRQYSDVQRQMYMYQQQLLSSSAASPSTSSSRHPRGAHFANPSSPKLNPLDSPGPVTPMELENAASPGSAAGRNEGGYLVAGVNGNMSASEAASHVEELIRKEAARRRGNGSPGRATAVAVGRS